VVELFHDSKPDVVMVGDNQNVEALNDIDYENFDVNVND
jgi:hypothetical protein